MTDARTVLKLALHGSNLISRSEAKRLFDGVENCEEVVLDFAGVETIGQGFADETFRVWARAHGGTRILPINMSEPVSFMVTRALREAGTW